MDLTAMTVTVYFVGLVNFSGTGTTREVVAPLASSDTSRTASGMTVTMAKHHGHIAIRGMKNKSICVLPFAKLVTIDGVDICSVTNVTGTLIELPSSSEPLTVEPGFYEIPKLACLCPPISEIDSDYLSLPSKYSMRLTISSGHLDACVNGKAWGTFLVLNATDDKLKIGNTLVELNPDAVVHIMNDPVAHTTSSREEHFWWYYTMYKDSTTCTRMGSTVPAGSTCFPKFGPGGPLHPDDDPYSPAATGPGCSNSNYP